MSALLLLLACHGPGPEDSVPPADSHGTPLPDDTATAPAERPLLVSPPDAPDLDPADGAVRVSLTADRATHEVDGVSYDGFAYSGLTPGPVLRARVGDVLTVEFENALTEATTVHWHGVSAPFAMDGVTWLSAPVPELSSFTYVVPLDHPGTFWYHPHVDVDRQVDLGLYGPIVVEDPADPALPELVLVFDTWGEVAADEHGLTNPEDQVWTVNGLRDPVLRGPAGERRRVRMINAANTGYLALSWPGATVVGGDQGLEAASTPDTLVLAPGDRAELLVTLDDVDVTTLPYVAAGGTGWGEPERLLSVETEGTAATPGPDLALPDAAPSADPGWTDLVYVFEGGADGESWSIDGEVWPDVTLRTAPLDAPTVIEVRNLSATEHPFHLHGNPFEVLSMDGVPPSTRTWADTVNVPIRSTLRILLTPHNPGDWMLHCHLLGHEQGGMMTVLRVE